MNPFKWPIIQSFLTLLLLILFLCLFLVSLPGEIESASIDVDRVLAHLRGLEYSLREERAARRMQSMFPEGACFTITLYGLAWANLADHLEGDDRKKALEEILYALAEQDGKSALAPFYDTQVRNGVFWLGQRNLLLGKYLNLLDPETRPPDFVEEFHENSSQLAAAFLKSPTRHLDSYPGMCWPTDNVTALASLHIHDALFGSRHRVAYEAWKKWTRSNSDPGSGMPAGHLNSKTGQHHQPARGCANSWMIAILGQFDPGFAAELYRKYTRHFGIQRLGFRMFREWPSGQKGHGADIDSGPIILGAGVTATGVGLAAARGQGDGAFEADIRDLSTMFGFPRTTRRAGKPATRHLLGLLPVGDAFLAWGYSIQRPSNNGAEAPSRTRRIVDRWPWFIIILIGVALTTVHGVFLGRRWWRSRQGGV